MSEYPPAWYLGLTDADFAAIKDENTKAFLRKLMERLRLLEGLVKGLGRGGESVGYLETSATISGGSITLPDHPSPSIVFLTVDTESAAAEDDLNTINGGGAGDFLVIQTANAARDVRLTALGNLNVGALAEIWLRSVNDKAPLWNNGTDWDALPPRNN